MTIEIVFKLAGIGILTSIINQILKIAGKDEIATLTTLASVIISLMIICDMLKELFGKLNLLFNFY